MDYVLKIIIIDDSSRIAPRVESILHKNDKTCHIKVVPCLYSFELYQQNWSPDIVISKYDSEHCNPPVIINHIREHYGEIPIIFISHIDSAERAVDTLKYGAADYVLEKNIPDIYKIIREHLTDYYRARNFRRAEKTMIQTKATEATARLFFNNPVDAILLFDLDGVILDLNDTTARRFKKNREDLIGKNLYLLLPHDIEKANREKVDEILEKKKPLRFEYRNQHIDTWDDYFMMPILDHENNVSKILSFAHDIREQKEIELQLHKAKRDAEKATKAKSEFLATMSHEIRTPLHAILNITSFLLDTELTGSQRGYLETVKGAGDHLLTVINDILDFEKIETGNLLLDTVDFDMYHLLKSTISMMTVQAKVKGLYLRLSIDESLPQFVAGDPVRFRQVLVNLIANALKFTETGGVTVSISLNKDCDEAGVGNILPIYCQIKDTGIGISEYDMRLIFQSFTQVDNSLKRRHQGTGLGLAISQKLVQLMQGKIQVSSKPGEGSIFSFTAFMKQSENGATEYPLKVDWETIRKEFPHLKIIMAEDNEVNVDVSKLYFNRMGCDVDVALNGKTFIEKLKIHKYDLALVDIEMPEIDGIEATKIVRTGEAGEHSRNIPIIAMTAHSLEDCQDVCLSAGMNDFISKPVDYKQLFALIYSYFLPSDHKMSVSGDNNKKKIINFEDNDDFFADNSEAFMKILKSFISKIPAMLLDIDHSFAQKDRELLRKTAHKYKSSAGTIQAERLFEILKTLEHESKERAFPELELIHQQLKHEAHLLNDTIQKRLESYRLKYMV